MTRMVTAAVAAGTALLLIVMLVVILAEEEQRLDCTPGGGGGLGNTIMPPGSVVKPMREGTYAHTSPYGMRWGTMHRGIDLGAAEGTPIYAFADGVVAEAGPASGFGMWIVLDHSVGSEKISTVYGHMWPHGVHVKTGDTVRAGQHIGDVGNNGQSYGAHLHFEVWIGGRFGGHDVDPRPYFDAGLEPGSAPRPDPSGDAAEGGDDPVDLVAAVTDTRGTRLAATPAGIGSEARMQLNGARGMRTVAAKFPEVRAIGGHRPHDPYPYHPEGRAIDVMIDNYATPEGKPVGDAVAQYFIDNAGHYEVADVIWRQSIWLPGSGWSVMQDRGSDTENHMDHVHVTFMPSPMATGAEEYTSGSGGGRAADPCAGLAGPGGDVAPGSVPGEYLPWLRKSAEQCESITPSLLAAQIEAESGFRTNAVSSAGALGPSQFMPATWAAYGIDGDGDGTIDPYSIPDAVMTQGRYMCVIAEEIDVAIEDGRVQAPNGRAELYLAGYNAGPHSVIREGGFPTGHPDYINQTRPYADKILALEPSYRVTNKD